MVIVDPLPIDTAKKKLLLVATNYLSKWVEAEADSHKLTQMSLPVALYRARKLLETPRMGRVWKVLEKSGRVHTILHYGGRHKRSPGLSREV